MSNKIDVCLNENNYEEYYLYPAFIKVKHGIIHLLLTNGEEIIMRKKDKRMKLCLPHVPEYIIDSIPITNTSVYNAVFNKTNLKWTKWSDLVEKNKMDEYEIVNFINNTNNTNNNCNNISNYIKSANINFNSDKNNKITPYL